MKNWKEAELWLQRVLEKENLKSQLRQANRLNVNIVLIMGQREALDETVILKDMESGSQEVITFKKVIADVKKRIAKSAKNAKKQAEKKAKKAKKSKKK